MSAGAAAASLQACPLVAPSFPLQHAEKDRQMTDEKRYPDECAAVELDWKERPEAVIAQVNEALAQRGIAAAFHCVDDKLSDYFEYWLIKEGERPPTVEEWRRHRYPADYADEVGLPGLRLVVLPTPPPK